MEGTIDELVIERVVERCFDTENFTEEDVERMCEEEYNKIKENIKL